MSSERGRTILYLHDPMPTRGPGRLREQLRVAIRLARGRPIDRVVVDSGSRRTAAGRGAALEALIREGARVPGLDVLIIEGISLLAPDPRRRRSTVADLLSAGFVLRDQSGELHPTRGTVALATAATRRRIRATDDPRQATRRLRRSDEILKGRDDV